MARRHSRKHLKSKKRGHKGGSCGCGGNAHSASLVGGKRRPRRHSRKHSRKVKRSRRQHRGGYAQYSTVKPWTPSSTFNDKAVNNFGTGNCVDNYNHYTGKGFQTPVTDGDVKH